MDDETELFEWENTAAPFAKARAQVINNALYIPKDASKETVALQRSYSTRRALVEAVTSSAAEYVARTGGGAEDFKNLASLGLDVVNFLANAAPQVKRHSLGFGPSYPEYWDFWKHDKRISAVAKDGDRKVLLVDDLGYAATSYLELPFRCRLLERCIVDMLIASEMALYVRDMIDPVPKWDRWLGSSRSPLNQRHVLLSMLIGSFWLAVTLGGVAAIAALSAPLIGTGASELIPTICLGLFVLLVVLDTVTLPFRWRAQRRARKHTLDLRWAMVTTYGELDPEHTISTRRVREVAVNAADKGVVWPSLLFVILDDNIARTGVL